MPAETIVDQHLQTIVGLQDHLLANAQTSLVSATNDWARKILLMSAASHFEHRLTQILEEFVSARSGGDEAVCTMFRLQAIERKYFQFFDWGGNNANGFFKLFGETLAEEFKSEVKRNPKIDSGVRAFLEIGRMRNELVHNDFGSQAVSLSYAEIYEKYRDALSFIAMLEDKLALPEHA